MAVRLNEKKLANFKIVEEDIFVENLDERGYTYRTSIASALES